MKKLYAVLGLLTLLGYAPVNVFNNQVNAQTVTNPVLSITPQSGEFYGVQVGSTWTLDFTIKNTGVSILKIKKIEVTGANFSLTDTTSYPFEVVSDTGAAFPVGNSGKSLKFKVNFSPTDLGLKTGKVIITYGIYTDEIREIPLKGEGLSCYAANVAVKGENWAPKQDIWFKYTADKFSIVEINACHPHQQVASTDSWPLYLYVFSDCQGTLTPGGGEVMENCAYGWEVPYQLIVMLAGETIYILWPLASLTSAHAKEGFYFNVKVTYPIDGDVCENAIPLTLPVINLFGNTRGVWDDYNVSPCSPMGNFMDGNDIVYSITLEEEGYLTGNIVGAYASIHVLDICPKEELEKDHCRAFAGGANGGQFRRKIDAGTYFVIISNWAPPQTVDYLLNMSWESVSAVENGQLVSSLNVYPNPASDMLTIGITNDESRDLTLELVTVSGQMVYRKEVKAAFSYNDEINVSGFARGIYYLKVNDGKDLKISKVVIE